MKNPCPLCCRPSRPDCSDGIVRIDGGMRVPNPPPIPEHLKGAF